MNWKNYTNKLKLQYTWNKQQYYFPSFHYRTVIISLAATTPTHEYQWPYLIICLSLTDNQPYKLNNFFQIVESILLLNSLNIPQNNRRTDPKWRTHKKLYHKRSYRRFTYGNLVTTSPSSRFKTFPNYTKTCWMK